MKKFFTWLLVLGVIVFSVACTNLHAYLEGLDKAEITISNKHEQE